MSTNFTTWAFKDGKNRKKLNRQVPRTLFICGLPGSGKSTLGKKIANNLNFSFIDLDHRITSETGISPAAWISEHSQEVFRTKEAEALRSISFSSNLVVSCGGGTPCFQNNLDWMLQHGVCLFLDVPEGMVLRRLEQAESAARPLIDENKMLESLRSIAESRKSCYDKIPHRIEPHRLSFAEIIAEVKRILATDQPK